MADSFLARPGARSRALTHTHLPVSANQIARSIILGQPFLGFPPKNVDPLPLNCIRSILSYDEYCLLRLLEEVGIEWPPSLSWRFDRPAMAKGRRKENRSTLSIYLTSRRTSRFNPEVPTQFEPMQPGNPCGFRGSEISLRI